MRSPYRELPLSLFLSLTLVCALLSQRASSCLAQVPLDFDADGISDFLSAAASGSNLAWSATGSVSGLKITETTFGLSTDIPVPARWEGLSAPTLAVVRANQGSKPLVWKIRLSNNELGERTFGRIGNLVMAGGDFDGDGIDEAATVRFKGKSIVWEIGFGFLAAEPKTKTLRFGRGGDRVFFFNPSGTRDWIASFGKKGKSRPVLRYRDTQSKTVRSVRGFSKAVAREPRPRPFPVRAEDGRDMIGFVVSDSSDTGIEVYGLDGKLINAAKFSGLGTVIAGEYAAELPGFEIVLQPSGSSEMIVYNPFTDISGRRAAVSQNLIDEVSIAQTLGPTPTAAPTGTATIAATPTT